MGLTYSIISGIAGGEATASFERRVLGEGDRGCNGRQSRSYSVAIASKFKCRYIDRIELGLDRATLTPKYTRGVGCYMPDPLSTTNPKPLLYLGNPPPGGRCRIPSSCRTDCDGFTHFWNSFKKSFTHLDSQGLARRLIASGCGFASTGTDCFGTQCAVYKKVGQEAYNEFGRELERRVAKEIEKFRDSGLGIALSWAPLAGSFADIFMSDLAGERPTAEQYALAAIDVAAAMIPGGFTLKASAKGLIYVVKGTGKIIAKVLTGIAKFTFKQAQKIFVKIRNKIIQSAMRSGFREPLIAKKSLSAVAKLTAQGRKALAAGKEQLATLHRTMLLKIVNDAQFRANLSAEIKKKLVKVIGKASVAAARGAERSAGEAVHGLSVAVKATGGVIVGCGDAQVCARINEMVDEMIHQARRRNLAKLMADMQKMPESVFEKTKAGGVGKFRGDMEAQLEKARGDGTETKVCDKDGCSYVWRSAKYEKLKDSAKATAVDHRGKIDLGVFLGFKRVCTGTRAQMNAKGCVVMTCLKDKCRGSQYRKQNDKGKWEAWGINWKDKEMRKQLRVAKEIYYGVHEDMKLWRHRQALIKRWGYIKAQMLLESEYNIGAQYDPSGTRPITTECVNSCLGGRRGDITSIGHLNRCFAGCAPTTAPSGGQRMAERIARLAREKAAARKATPTPTPTVPPPRITPIRSEPVHRPPPAHGEHFTSPGAPTAPPSAPASRRRAPAIKKTPGRPTSSYYAMTGVAA